MSVFSNPKPGGTGTSGNYITALLDMLGHHEPMSVLRETSLRVRHLIEGQPEEVLRRPEARGKWSAVEVVQHLADAELISAYRLRAMVAEGRPTHPGYEGTEWATRLHYRDVDPSDALHQFELLRRLNLRLLDSLSPEDLRRITLQHERGEESLDHMVRLFAGHDLVHLRQIERILKTVTPTAG
jgi:hypothetical protein